VTEASGVSLGAKELDYPWTVLAVDPLAAPIVRLLSRTRWLTPDQVTELSLVLGLPTGVLYAIGTRSSLAAGAALFYGSFVLDCVDGKLARSLRLYSDRGRRLDALADELRRTSASLGLAVYLWRRGETRDIWWALGFGALTFVFMRVSGAERPESTSIAGGRWRQAMARRRLLPTPGMPDVSAIVYIAGPLSGHIVPALIAGAAMVTAGLGLTARRRLMVAR
jgi:phosphatidylglycerophosphate synthase